MYEDSTGGLIAVAVCGTIGVLVLLVCLVLALNDAQQQKNSGKQMAEVMRKYSTMRPEDVDSSTISSFHKELRDCFDSDDAYSNHVNSWANNKSIEISSIDTMLLSYYTMNLNKDNDSLDTEPIDSSRYERYM